MKRITESLKRFRGLVVSYPRPWRGSYQMLRLMYYRCIDGRSNALAVDHTHFRVLGFYFDFYTTRPGHDGRAPPVPKIQFLKRP